MIYHFTNTLIRNTLRMCCFDEITFTLNPILMWVIAYECHYSHTIALKALILNNKRDTKIAIIYIIVLNNWVTHPLKSGNVFLEFPQSIQIVTYDQNCLFYEYQQKWIKSWINIF